MTQDTMDTHIRLLVDKFDIPYNQAKDLINLEGSYEKAISYMHNIYMNPPTTQDAHYQDQNLDRAITEIVNNYKAPIAHPVSGYDADLEKALMASIQDSNTQAQKSDNESNSPLREEGMPVGLKNVGNTCYANSLLQAYFNIPLLRKEILSAPILQISSDDTQEVAQSKTFFRELQDLFCHMEIGNKKWVDPSKLLRSIIDSSGRNNIGSQEDVGEFMDLFHEWMSNSLKLIRDENQDDIMKELFTIESVDILEATEENGDSVSMENDTQHSFLIIDIEDGDIYSGLDNSFCDEVEWNTPNNFPTIAKKTTWLRHLPPVIMMQEQRIRYNTATGAFKTNTEVNFPKDIDMARYKEENKELILNQRIEINALKEELKSIESDINQLENFRVSRKCFNINHQGKGIICI
eukprot:TRINITY_DN7430_c0_g1_i2.p1 TRINITY_DN7430_c0_g1~~TRINITY_DN7430_c0_g1_i2.p1  ORF type:complete len:407 (+),score=98.88 TRINITY_DN7430_c0_g1_i2:41-1261(+)